LNAEDAYLFPEFKLFASCGELGCAFAHLSILLDHIDKKDDRILAIFEDDVVFCDDFLDRLEYLQKVPTFKWDMFYLSAFIDIPGPHGNQGQMPTNIRNVHRVFDAYTTHSYLVNPKSLVHLFEMLKISIELGKCPHAIDSMWCSVQPFVYAYCFIPGMVAQRKGMSDVSGGERDVVTTQGKGPVSHMYSPTMEQFDYDAWRKTLPKFSGKLFRPPDQHIVPVGFKKGIQRRLLM
jgi:hypothetical protein